LRVWYLERHGDGAPWLQHQLVWLPTVETLVAGVSFGMPLLLFLRQVTLD
jgi:hypothetical protein